MDPINAANTTWSSTTGGMYPSPQQAASRPAPTLSTLPGDYVVRKVQNGWIILVAPPFIGGEVREYVCHQDSDIGEALKATMVTEKVVDK